MLNRKIFQVLNGVLLVFWLSACTTRTTENSHRSVKDFPSGEQLIVDVTNQHEEQVGVVSKVVYGIKDRHHYQLRFLPHDLRWENGDAEPKQLIVCTNGAAYLHFVSQQPNPYYATAQEQANTTEPNTVEQAKEPNIQPTKVESYVISKNHYVRAVDKRYFFNWLGEFYWIDIEKAEYISKQNSCQVYEVPNDAYYQDGRN